MPRTSSAKVAAIRSASAAAAAEAAEVAAMAEAAAERVQALREGLQHDDWETQAVRAQLAGKPVGTAPAAIAHTAQAGLCYCCVSWRVPIRSTADHFSFRRGWLTKGEKVDVVEIADHPTHGRSLRCSRKLLRANHASIVISTQISSHHRDLNVITSNCRRVDQHQ